jgi:hypothetical protein
LLRRYIRLMLFGVGGGERGKRGREERERERSDMN